MGGIKTNISLFRRILTNPDFRAAKLDTGFLDRMLKQNDELHRDAETAPHAAEVAAIAAGMFAVLAPAANGIAGVSASNGSATTSTWKKIGRDEALRRLATDR